MSLVIDAVLHLDGLMLRDGDSIEDIVEFIQTSLTEAGHQLGYDIKYEVKYEEEIIDD